ncbi:MAG TPA: methyltransferase domain-containing protein [Gaiellaceae bacterium]|nr:methyltransferase domain-containing protein [Gaiellaceae bacterium]
MTGGGSSIPEVQRLLAVLAAGKRCAELGSAYGEGAAAIASTAASLVTVERDPDRIALARERLAGVDNVELLEGDWRDLLPQRGPFELVFLDSGDWKEEPARQQALDLVEPGGLLLKDDMTPGLPGPDPVREWFFGHPDLLATEILTTPETAAIVATKRR